MSKTNKFHIHWEFSKAEFAVFVTSILLLCFSLFYVLFAYTPLHDIIPGYPTAAVRRQHLQNALRIDSLERSILRWELYSQNLRSVIAGKQPVSIESIIPQVNADSLAKDATALAKNDSTLRAMVELLETVEVDDVNKRNMQAEGIHFFKPLTGTVSASFDAAMHPYIDITAPEGSPVKAVLDGSVIYTEWSEAYGWSMIIQHENGIISIYRNNQKLLKNVADPVVAGTSVALLGGTSLTEGCHLQFELWQNGAPLDPTAYINF